MMYLFLALLLILVVVFFVYPIQAVLGTAALIICAIAYIVYQKTGENRAQRHRIAMQVSAEERRNAKEARLQQAHEAKMRKS